MKLEDEVFELIRRRLKLPPDNTVLDSTIEMYMDEIKQRIINYTHQLAIPAGLKYTWSNMVIDLLKVRDFALPEVAALLGKDAVEVKIGDTSVKLGSTGSVAVETIVTSYAPELRRYRRMGWQG
ncbi:hypothetical protein T3H97_06320 [Paenibacillus sp. LX16]|uniref:hypothetical protein n=1 Tax=Paenibacillus sp. LX16 TaxID=1740264 RepID=UPI002E2BD0C8|nr:hypothetical protein [Paenibacillus sp. LX16]